MLGLHAEDCYFFARPATSTFKRTIYCKASTHHRSCGLGADVVRDLEGEVFVCSDVAGVSTLGDGTVRVGSTIGVCGEDQQGLGEMKETETATYQPCEGSSSHCRFCSSCTLSRPGSERQHQRGRQPSQSSPYHQL